MPRTIFVPITGETWESTDDPEWWRTVDPCGADCHDPIHAMGRPNRRRHLERASFIERHGTERED